MTERTFPCNELIKRDCGMMPLYTLVMLVHSAVFNQNQYKAGVNFLAPPLSLSLSLFELIHSAAAVAVPECALGSSCQ